jgi:hypothetical protein
MTLVAVSAAYRFRFSVAQNAVTSDIEITCQHFLFLRKNVWLRDYSAVYASSFPSFEHDFQIWRVAGNMLNIESQAADKG